MDESRELGSVLKDSLLAVLGETPDDAPPPPFLTEPPAPPQSAAATSASEQPPPPTAAPPITMQAQQSAQPGSESQGQCTNIPTIPDSMIQHLRPVGVLNGVLICCIAPQLHAAAPAKKKRQEEQDGPYIKKPPNAFMLFLKEQRPKVVAECGTRDSAAVNAIVGQRWKSLTKDQQAVYYKEAEEQRMLHAQQHPEWSAKDNYGIKRRRVRVSTCSTASAPPAASCSASGALLPSRSAAPI